MAKYDLVIETKKDGITKLVTLPVDFKLFDFPHIANRLAKIIESKGARCTISLGEHEVMMDGDCIGYDYHIIKSIQF